MFVSAFKLHADENYFHKMLNEGQKITSNTQFYDYLKTSVTQTFDNQKMQTLLAALLSRAFRSYFLLYKKSFITKIKERIE